MSTNLELKLAICKFMIISIFFERISRCYLFHKNVITSFTRDVLNSLLYVNALANLKITT